MSFFFSLLALLGIQQLSVAPRSWSICSSHIPVKHTTGRLNQMRMREIEVDAAQALLTLKKPMCKPSPSPHHLTTLVLPVIWTTLKWQVSREVGGADTPVAIVANLQTGGSRYKITLRWTEAAEKFSTLLNDTKQSFLGSHCSTLSWRRG